MKRKALFIIAFVALSVCTFSPLGAQSRNQHQKDSLRKEILSAEDKSKLKLYNSLAILYMPEIRGDEHIIDTIFALYDEMNAIAVKEGDLTYQSHARANKLIALSNKRLYDRVIAETPAALDFFTEHNQWSSYYSVSSILIDVYRRKREKEKALQEAQSLYEHAKAHKHVAGTAIALRALSKIYLTERRFADAEKCLRECIKLLPDSIHYLGTLSDAYSDLAGNLTAQKRYKDALQVISEFEKVNHRCEKESKSLQPLSWINLWNNYINVYLQTGEYENADIYINKVDSISKGSVVQYEQRAQVLYGKGKYDEALEMIEKEIERYPNSLQPKGLKLMILIQMGKAEEGYHLFRSAVIALDSIRNADYNARLDEIHTQYQVDKHIAEKERNRNYFLFALGSCLLLIILLGGAFRYNRIITRKNRSLYKQIQDQRRIDKDIEQVELQIPAEKLSRERKLYLELQHLMLAEKHFVDPTFDRNKVSKLLGTNHQYLANALKQETGLTFGGYVADLRLKYALELLADHPDLTLNAVALDSGHGSYSSFFRAFTQKYGMSPSEFRKFSSDENIGNLPVKDEKEEE